MALLTPTELRSVINSHGLRPYDLVVEFAPEQPSTFFLSFGQLQWAQRPVKAGSLGISYGAESQSFTFSTWDPATVEAAQIVSPSTTLKVPVNGEFVVVTIYDQTTGQDGRVLFRGTIRAVHEHISEAGKSYNCEAISEASRLNDFHVTFTANFHNDPVNPSPRFDNAGNILNVTKLKTLYEITQDIFNFQDAWQSDEFFKFTDINWNGLDTDVRCGLYVPTTMCFQDTPKGKAFEDLLSRAGNFTFLYVPQRDGRGSLQVVELNLACDSCGDEWSMNWPPATAADQILTANYAYAYIIGDDNTEWNTKESCNVIRMTTSPIRFYTGNWMIPELIDGDNNVMAVTVDNDTAAAQIKRAVSLDGVNYRFTFIGDNAQDVRTQKRYPVGMPLYPDWNIHEDWLPAFLEIQNVQLPATGANFTKDKYVGLIEFQPFTVGHEIINGTPRLKHINNLRIYQAWYSDTSCPACTPSGWPVGAPGTGLVQNVYTGPDNEPILTFEAIVTTGDNAGDRRTIGPTDTLVKGERILFHVSNYIMNPSDFGTGKPKPAGLTPWQAPNPGDYPLPWKNTCPYCRGTGMSPKYKIRDIEPVLFAGRNNQINQPDGVNEIPVDPEFTQTAPETWEQTQTRLAMHETAWVVVETPIMTPQIPTYVSRNVDFPAQKLLPSDQQRNQFAHPLAFVSLFKRLPQFAGHAASDPEMQIVPPEWKCEVPYTTIAMRPARCNIDYPLGQVIFEEPHFIPCRMPFTTYIRLEDGKYLITNDILTKRGLGRGQMTADKNWNPSGFWRFAKAWITCYFTRNLHYDYMYNDPKTGMPIPTTTFTNTDADGNDANYDARTSIHDGKLVIEVRQTNPNADQVGGTMFPTGDRTLQRAITDYDAVVNTSYADLFKMPLPNKAGMTIVPATNNTSIPTFTPPGGVLSQDELEVYKTSLKLDFPRGRILKIEATTPGEIQAEMAGYTTVDYQTSVIRPKVFTWRSQDDRSLLLARAIRELELSNQIIVGGPMTLIGVSHDFTTGLGFVNKPGKGKAIVKRAQFNFTEALQVEIELSREEARFGEVIKKPEDRMDHIEVQVAKMQRITDYVRATQAAEQQSPVEGTGSEVDAGPGIIYRGS